MQATRTDSDRIPLILIHGAWVSARSWENCADYFGKRGFAVSARSLDGVLDAPVAADKEGRWISG